MWAATEAGKECLMLEGLILDGRVAVVTGGRRGMGRAVALAFARSGADVAVCDIVAEDGLLDSVAREIRELGRRSLAIQTDTSLKSDVHKMALKVAEEFGTIDILFNHAGINIKSPLLEMAEEDWDKVMDVDLKGYFLCSQEVGKIMVRDRKGVIINTASQFAFRTTPGRGAYCVAKAGIVMLTRVLAKELSAYGIRVNAIAPGLIRTEFSRGTWGNPDALKEYEQSVPLGRSGQVEDIIGTVLLLASAASSYITGATINIDGGTLA
jgi:NAD(P)-dependent dehydrogenase (short-subunit alcohol dehydrogenase family)